MSILNKLMSARLLSKHIFHVGEPQLLRLLAMISLCHKGFSELNPPVFQVSALTAVRAEDL